MSEEIACSFGDNSQLVGVYTKPKRTDDESICAIYITAGFLHHVGPTRLHVELARTLSRQSIAGLRFDLSGIGDSETSSLGGYFTERSVAEIRAAMNFLQEQYGHKKFVLIGLCSGADDALATAQQDTRVNGVVLLNGYAYPAGNYKLYRFKEFVLPRLLMWEKWVNKIKRSLTGQKSTSELIDAGAANTDAIDSQEKAAVSALDDDYRYIPPKEETGNIIKKLTNDGVQLFFIYSGSEYDTYTYQGQLKAMFPELIDNGRVQEKYIKEADHTFILKADRDKLSAWVENWFDSCEFRRLTG